MATGIIVPGRRLVTQPQYFAPLNRSSKFSSRIKLAYSVGRGVQDGAHGLGSVTGTMTYGAGPKGRNVKPADASSYIGFADNPDYNILGDITVIALVDIGGTTVQQGIITKCETGGGANTPWALLVESGGAISFNRSNGGGFRVWASSATLSANTTYLIFVKQVADMSVAPKFYINGILDTGSPTSLYGGGGTGAATGNTTSVKIGNRTDLGTQFFGTLYESTLLAGLLSDAEIADYARNVYAIWQAPARRIWVSIAAGGTAYTQSLAGSLTPAGALTKQTSKPLSGSSTATGSLVKQTAKAFAGSVTGSGALSTMILFTASVAGSITPAGTLSKMTQKALVGASTLTGAITKLTNKGLSASITLSGALNKLTTKAFAGSITVTGALAEAYQVVKSLAGSITPAGALATAYIAFVAGVLKMLSLLGVGQ